MLFKISLFRFLYHTATLVLHGLFFIWRIGSGVLGFAFFIVFT